MTRILVILFSALIILQGCGSGNEPSSDKDKTPSGGSGNPPDLVAVDVDAQYIDSYWLPGGRNYAVYENSLAVGHYTGVSLLNISDSGLVESEIQVSSAGTNNIATLTGGEIATLNINHVRVNSLQSNMLDVIHMTEASPDLSAVIFASYNNCAYWVNRGAAEEPLQKVNEICVDSQGAITIEAKYDTENWIDSIFFLEDGSMVVSERLSGQQKISLLSSDFSLVDEHITTQQLYGFDIEFRNGTLFFSGFAAMWEMAIDSNGLSEPQIFHETVNPRAANGTNGIAVHDEGVFIANNNFIYSYDLNGDEVSALYRIDVEKDIDALVVYKDFLIVSYMDNIGIRIYKISDLLG